MSKHDPPVDETRKSREPPGPVAGRSEASCEPFPTAQGDPDGVVVRPVIGAGAAQPPELLSVANYDLQEVIGRGGMSVVYKARHKFMGSYAAIKMLHLHLQSQESAVKRFLAEAQAIKALAHPNIVEVFDFGVSASGYPYLVMEYLEGMSLAEMIKHRGRVPVPVALAVFLQAAGAIAHAHARGVVHRDLKPGNIMLVKRDADEHYVKIVDFGIAKLTQAGESAQHLTQTGEVIGSPLYMSPEQCRGEKLDARSDIYSFGCLMYDVLTGSPPFAGETALAIMHAHLTETPAPPAIPGCGRHLVERLDAILFRALEKEPARRYQNMTQVFEELRGLQADQDALAMLQSGYLRLARSRRAVACAIKEHPFRTVIMPGAILAGLFLALAVGVPVYSLMFEPPASSQQWVWNVPAQHYEPASPKAERMLALAGKLINNYQRAGPEYAENVRKCRRYVVQQCLECGRLSDAYSQLSHMYSEMAGSEWGKSRVATDGVIIPYADCIMKLNPESESNERELVQAAVALYRQAVTNYERTRASKEEFASLYLKLGRALETAGDAKGALAIYMQADEVVMHLPVGLKVEDLGVLGDAHMRIAGGELGRIDLKETRDHYELAIMRYAQAQKLCWPQSGPDTENKSVSFNEGLCVFRMAECNEKLAGLDEGPRQTSEANSFYSKAARDYTSATELFGDREPFVTVSMRNRARMLWQERQWVEALRLQWRIMLGERKS